LTAAPQDPEVQTRLAYLLDQAGAPDRAAVLYEAALRGDPNQVPALVNLARLVGLQGALDGAIAMWRSALGRNPCLEEAGTNLQIALRANRDAAAAEAVRRSQSACIF
jgi:Flp pilus assembly protein TadD